MFHLRSPYERSFPYHQWVLDEQAKLAKATGKRASGSGDGGSSANIDDETYDRLKRDLPSLFQVKKRKRADFSFASAATANSDSDCQ